MTDSLEKNTPSNNSYKTGSTRFYFVTLTLLIILASIERVYGIDRQSLWSDELYAVMASYKYHFKNVWSLLVADSHPPGYVTLMYFALPWFGYSDFAVRLHALIYGILWIPLVYWIGKRWFSHETGLLAATLIASSYTAIYYSQEARAYSMLVAFCLGNLICFLEILFAKKLHRGYVFGFIISSILDLYLHYSGFVFLAAEVLLYVSLWLIRYRKGSWREMAKYFGIPLLLYLPWMGVMIGQLLDTSLNWSVSAKPTIIDVYYTFQNLLGPDRVLLHAYLYSLLILILLSGYDHIKHGLSRQIAIVYTLLFLLVIPVLAFYVESIIWTPIFEKRYFLTALPLAALMVAHVVDQVLHLLIRPPWQKTCLMVILFSFSMWLINANLDRNIYTVLDKDPIREAVAVIKKDLDARSTSKNYTVLMSHDWFEHYLRRAQINYDRAWSARLYDVPSKIEKINDYLKERLNIDTFYYLSLSSQNTRSATFALRQRYKLLDSTQITTSSGSIDVLKFSAIEAPDDDQLESAGTNNINEAAKIIAKDVGQKNPDTYTTVFTHEWMELYLLHNKISLDKTWSGRKYYQDVQSPELDNYLHNHPNINTLYYMALSTPTVDDAGEILQLQYQLLSKKTVESSVGKIDLYKFNTRVTPTIAQAIKEQTKNNPLNKIAGMVSAQVQNTSANSYAVIMSHGWFQPYLQLNAIPIDKTWDGRMFNAEFQAESVFAYVNQHPAINTLYYLRLNESNGSNALLPLLLKYQLMSTETVNAPVGKLELLRFNTQSKNASNVDIVDLSKSAIYLAAASIAKNTANKNYVVLTTHPWFGLYLKKAGISMASNWPGRFYTNEQQADEVFKYLTAHPVITDVYYMAFRNDESETAASALQKKLHLVSKNAFDSSAGHIDILQFSTK